VRDNPDLDAAFAGDDVNTLKLPKPKAKRRRRSSLHQDQVRRLAFRVLGILANHNAGDRQRVLRFALKINKAT
jgi:hypothetical protein